MASYTVDEITRIVRGKMLKQIDVPPITQVVLDSRWGIGGDHCIFFALRGTHRDGHQFLGEAHRQGIRTFVVSREEAAADLEPANVILVRDAVHALQLLAAHHRRQFNIPVIGITGSNGKTIVKEWLYQLLAPDYTVVRSPRSYNSQIGVPLSVWQMDAYHQLAIFEAGISQAGEMDNLARVIQPTIGVFTNIGEAHSEGFLNIRQKINEKLRLFTHAEVLIYCRDYLDINECVLTMRAQLKHTETGLAGLRTFTWSREGFDAEVQITSIVKALDHTQVTLQKGEEYHAFTIPFTDDASIENAIHCWMVLHWLGLPSAVAASRLQHVPRVAMRLELKEAIQQSVLINDSYNSDWNSLAIALDFLAQQRQYERRTVILSDILQSGLNEKELYQSVANLLQRHGVRRLIGIGQAISSQSDVFRSVDGLAAQFYSNTDQFLNHYREEDFSNEAILLKGARLFEFERIARKLERQIHETTLTIDLAALQHNLRVYRSLLAPSVRVMVMVKAFSYGIGSTEIAHALQLQNVDYLAVAYTDEGVVLRKAGVTVPLMVMHPDPAAWEAIFRYRLEPALYNLRMTHLLLAALQAWGEQSQPVSLHIELETGMHRLGFPAEQLEELAALLNKHPTLQVKSVFTHLSASDDARHDGYTRLQIDRFTQMSGLLAEKLPYRFLRHVVSSAGIIRFPEAHFDMVRLGIGLYGFDASGVLQAQLKNVGSLKTTISQIHEVKAGEHVSYGDSGKSDRVRRIATVAIGYADGLQRSLGNGRGHMLVRQRRCPIVGNICMDMCMLDVTAVDDCREGDEVMVFGEGLPATEVAQWARTIPYEIISTISRRVKRIYVQG